MAPNPRASKAAKPASQPLLDGPLIQCSAQQSRFHSATLDSHEVDVHDLSISIGESDLLVGAHLRLKEGVKYGLVGRNGTGKSTLLQAIADRLIPGLSPSLRILLLSQVEDTTRALALSDDGSVLDHVVKGDKERLKAVREFEELTNAMESTSLAETRRIVGQLLVRKAEDDLVEARKVASRRSGTRGKEAREEEIKAEENLRRERERLGGDDEELAQTAMEMLAEVGAKLEQLESDTTDSRAATILVGLGFTQAMMDGPFGALSGGWRSRCSLATSLLVHSDILLLDEPSNFLDLEAIIWLESFLASDDRTLVLISHDQEFLNHAVEETIVLRNKTLKYFEGNPRAFEINDRKERTRLRGQKEALDKKKEHIEKSIQQGIASAKKTGDENRQRMVKSRQKKLDERWGAETSAKGTRFKLNRDMAGFHLTNRAEIIAEAEEARVKLSIPNPEKLRTVGDLVSFDAVEYRFPKAKAPLLSDVTFTVPQGGRVAFVGANGQGKSTLAKLILGSLSPSKGTVTRHPLLKIGYFGQHSVEDLSRPLPNRPNSHQPLTPLSYFLGHFEEKGERVLEQDARACLGSFGLPGRVASDTPLEQLSGGQKVRLAFALLIFHPPPLLLLDEISTHLDIATLSALSVALKNFQGAIVLVTHDRWFSRIVIEGSSPRSILAEEGDASDLDESASSNDEESERRKVMGQTFRVGGGKLRLMENGMKQYVALVERKLEKRRKADAVKG